MNSFLIIRFQAKEREHQKAISLARPFEKESNETDPMIPNKPPPPPPRTCINNVKETVQQDDMKKREINHEKRVEEQEAHCVKDAHSIHDETKDNINSIPKFIKHEGNQEPNTTSDDSSLLGPYHSCLKSRNQTSNIFIRDGFKEQKEFHCLRYLFCTFYTQYFFSGVTTVYFYD